MTRHIEFHNPPTLMRAVGYAHGVETHGGRLLFFAGQVAKDRDGRVVGKGDLVAQFRQVCDNLKTLVAAAGGRLTDVVKLTIYVLDAGEFKRQGTIAGTHVRSAATRRVPSVIGENQRERAASSRVGHRAGGSGWRTRLRSGVETLTGPSGSRQAGHAVDLEHAPVGCVVEVARDDALARRRSRSRRSARRSRAGTPARSAASARWWRPWARRTSWRPFGVKVRRKARRSAGWTARRTSPSAWSRSTMPVRLPAVTRSRRESSTNVSPSRSRSSWLRTSNCGKVQCAATARRSSRSISA